jgi:50S ribosomal subunit-associated GTPase HflX
MSVKHTYRFAVIAMAILAGCLGAFMSRSAIEDAQAGNRAAFGTGEQQLLAELKTLNASARKIERRLESIEKQLSQQAKAKLKAIENANRKQETQQ